MKNNNTPATNPQEPLAMIQARLVFVAPLPDGQQALGFVDGNGKPLLAITQANAIQPAREGRE